MGWSLTWLASNKLSRQEFFDVLRLRATGRNEDLVNGKVGYLELPSGWKLVLFDHREFSDKGLRALTTNCDLLYSFVEEHVMFSKTAEWSLGTEVWSVTHAAEQGEWDLQVKGRAPSILAQIREVQTAAQKQEDESSHQHKVDHLFEIPVQVAAKLTGFRYDQSIPGVWEDSVEILESNKSQKPSFLKRVFGRSE